MALEDVKYQPNFDIHTTFDRTITTLTNGDIENFLSENVRIVQFKVDTVLGNHWREYPELYGIIGNALFILEDIETKKRENYEIKTGDRLYIPPRIALKVRAQKDIVIIVCSPKTNRDEKTHKYEVKD